MKNGIDQIAFFFAQETLFRLTAYVGTAFFVFLFLLMLFGTDSESDLDGNFKWMSKQAIAGFLMLFGWSGLTAMHELALSPLFSIGVALFGGFCALFGSGLIFKGAMKLKSSGSVFRLDDTIGKEGLVYQTIPANGIGKITVSIHHFTHEIDAISKETIPSFTPIQIIQKIDDKTVLVIPK